MDRHVANIGIIGAGLMGRWHAHAACRAGGRIAAIADPDKSAAAAISKKYGGAVFESAEDLFKYADVNFVHICTPTTTHDELVAMAVKCGAHAFVEKPFASNASATRDLLEHGEAARVRLCPVHQYAFQNSLERFLSRRTKIGNIAAINLQFFTAGGAGFSHYDWPRVAADILPHPVSILQRLFPGTDLTSASWRIAGATHGHWEMSTAIEGVFVCITLSLISRPTGAHLTVDADNGSFEADLFHDYSIWMGGEVSRSAKIAQPFERSFKHLAAASVNLARRGLRREPAYPGLVNLTKAFYRSGDAGSPIQNSDIIAAAKLRDHFLAATAAPDRSENPARQSPVS